VNRQVGKRGAIISTFSRQSPGADVPSFAAPPLRSNAAHFFCDAGSGITSVPVLPQELIVLRFRVTDMGYDGQIDGLIGEALGGRRPANPAAILQTGVFRNDHLPSGRAMRIKFPYAGSKTRDVLLIEICSAFCFPLTPPHANLGVGQALLLGLLQRLLLDQQPLSFVPLASLAPLEHHRRQRRVLSGTPRHGRIACGQKNEMVQIGARQAQRSTVAGKHDPSLMAELLATLVANGLPGGDENLRR